MTPSGLPQRGDRVRHKPTGKVCTVVRREGNGMLYSLILRPDDGRLDGCREAYAYPGCFRLLEADYWLRNTYELVPS